MAINFNDLKVTRYIRAPQPFVLTSPVGDQSPEQKFQAFTKYIEEEFRRVEQSITSLAIASPQVAIKEPTDPSTGLIRYAKSPWNPLGTGNAWVYWDGSNWVAL